jgi:pimeloyl-ACP methyl ester carboxylesterase
MNLRPLAGLVALLAIPPTAGAAGFAPCGKARECATLTVPLGSTPGTTQIAVQRLRAAHPTRPPIVLVTGGPGQSGLRMVQAIGRRATFAPDALRRDVIGFDPRGTGASDVLRCPALERSRSFFATDAAAACWSSLGPNRYAYTSRAVADDIDAIRAAAGASKIAIYGVSYGTSPAQVYARVHPDHTDRLILDSAVPPSGLDPLYRPTFAAIPRVLGGLCKCADDVARLVGMLPLPARAVGDDGRPHAVKIDRYDVFDVIFDSDLQAALRGAVPGAVRDALAGDPASLARLARAVRELDGSSFTSPQAFSIADYAATVCEENPFPWGRTATPEQRGAQIRAAVAATPAGALAPFDQATVLQTDFLATCLRWPASAQPPDLGTADPDVPVLVLSGEDDLRAPLEQARAIAGRYPHAVLRSFPHAGHDVLGSLACARQLVRHFLAGAAVGACRDAHLREPELTPSAARSAGRGLHGVLEAVIETIEDRDRTALLAASGVVPGLRAGTATRDRTRHGAWRMDRFTYVRGVALTGTDERLRVTGRVRGRARLGERTLSLTVGRRRVAMPLPSDLRRHLGRSPGGR